ncbi:unnamed protein product [Prunus armeniaca]
MASLKKSKKSKKYRKLKKNLSLVPIEPKAADSDWWDSFFNPSRNSPLEVDKFDFVVCMSAYIGVVFGSVETGLVLAVAISVIRVVLFVARPRTFVQGNLPNSMVYRNVEQYPNASNVPGILILEIDAPIYFANANYLRERHTGWRGLDEGIVVVGTCMI